MILINGCSFTDGTALKDSKYSYVNILSSMLNQEIEDISEGSKNNFYMAFELSALLLNRHYNNKELPKIIIWQQTDVFRDHLPDFFHSGSWKPNNLNSILGRKSVKFRDRFIKVIAWQRFSQILANRKLKTRDGQDSKILKDYKTAYGMGSNIIPDNSRKNKAFLTGDDTFQLNEFRHAVNIINLQNLCDKLGVRLIHYNYYKPLPKLLNDPIVQLINRNDYVIENSLRGGMYNHLRWKGFGRPDDFHFDESAHYYQAHILYNYITNGTRLKVEEEPFDEESMPLYDYTNEFERPYSDLKPYDGRSGRNLLLSLSNQK